MPDKKILVNYTSRDFNSIKRDLEEHAKRYSLILKSAMEEAEEKWLGVDIPAVADVQIGTTWAEVH